MEYSVSLFTKPLKTITLPDDKRLICEPFRYWIVEKGKGLYITVPAYFITDGASIPRTLWPVIGHPFKADVFQAAVVHDFLYQRTGEIITYQKLKDIKMASDYIKKIEQVGWDKYKVEFHREGCDRILKEGALILGTNRVKAHTIYTGVRSGGWYTWWKYKRRRKKK